MAEDVEQLIGGEHDLLAHAAHDVARNQNDMVGALALSVGNGAAEAIGAEADVGVGEQNPFRRRSAGHGLFCGQPHGMRLAQPSRRKIGDVQHVQRRTGMRGGNTVEDLAGGIGGAVVDGKYFIVRVIKTEHGPQSGFDVRRFVARGNDDADAWRRLRQAVIFRASDVGNAAHVAGVAHAVEPDQGEKQSEKPPGNHHRGAPAGCSSPILMRGAKCLP
jgi:hypothetical protein